MTRTFALAGDLRHDERLAAYTTWRVGGKADIFYCPRDKQDLQYFMMQLSTDTAVLYLGLGSNVLIRDKGFRGAVVHLRGNLKALQCLGGANTVYVEAGVPCAHVARFCAEQGLVGAEFLAGIPGTMGGALRMNAGAFGGETWQLVKRVEWLSKAREIVESDAVDFKVGYRTVLIEQDACFLSAVLQLAQGKPKDIKTLLAKRNATQPTNKPSCGSVFKNPEGDYAARLIEACGLKGYALGGAEVSTKHANFIINTGHARAADIEALIEHVQAEVLSAHGVNLQTEVHIVGEA